MDENDKLARIELMAKFSADLKKHFDCSRKLSEEEGDILRQQINESLRTARRFVFEAGCLKTVTIGPPPAVGGLVLSDVDPFDMIFDPPYGQSVIPMVRDMLQQAIGVTKEPDFDRTVSRPMMLAGESIRPGFAFVAMSMDPLDGALVDVLDAIKAACAKCGVTAERIDDQNCNDPITDRMLESIRLAEFVIVDLTHEKPNVYYEAGYAQGFGKTPIYVAKSGTKLHFDLKDYPVIFFENLRSLKDQLMARLKTGADDGNLTK